MGSKHPISLRLKTKLNWENTSYHFNSKNSLHQYWGFDKIALNVIKHYFQFALISKPKFNKDSNKVVISFYYFLNLPVSKRLNFGQSKRIQSSLHEGSMNFEAKRFSSLILKLSYLYGKPVELRPVRVHYPYLNSYILAQYIAHNIQAGYSNKLIQKLLKKAKLIESNNSTSIKFRDLIKYSSVLNEPQYLTGIKIKISGRLSQRKAASRTKTVIRSSGTLNSSSFTSSIDASKFSFTGKNGTITVKIMLSSSFANSLVNNRTINRTNITNTPLLQSSHSSNIGNSKTQGLRFYSSNAGNNSINNETFVPVIVYKNADIDKFSIFTDNKKKAGIYLWTHLESNNQYIGSAIDLSIRLKKYYSINHLESNKTMRICNALGKYGYSAFSLSILEYVDITGLSKDQTRKLIIEREQHFIDTFKPEYNILKTAGSRLGMETSDETKEKLSKALSGSNNAMFGKTGNSHPKFGLVVSTETREKISFASSSSSNFMRKKVFIYSIDFETKEIKLYKSLDTCKEAANYLKCSTYTITNYLDKNKLYKKQYMLYSSEQ